MDAEFSKKYKPLGPRMVLYLQTQALLLDTRSPTLSHPRAQTPTASLLFVRLLYNNNHIQVPSPMGVSIISTDSPLLRGVIYMGNCFRFCS